MLMMKFCLGIAVLYGVVLWRLPHNLHPEDAVPRPGGREVLQAVDRVPRVHQVDVDQQQQAQHSLAG